jgi:hypothetical protein
MNDLVERCRVEGWIVEHLPVVREIIDFGYARCRGKCPQDILDAAKRKLDELVEDCK